MERKRRGNREGAGRLWGFFGALWLVMACLAGCGASGSDTGNRAGGDRAAEVAVSEAAGTEGKPQGAGSGESVAEETKDRKIQGGGTAAEESEAAETGGSKNSGETAGEEAPGNDGTAGAPEMIEESGTYTSKDQVALYLHTYGRLPENYITKRDAEDLGWDSKKGNLWEVAPGMSIGGSRFGNYEGALPDKKGRKYFECDIDYEGGYRGAKRLIYSDDGLIFYTEDHYNTFEQLYGE